MDQSELRQLLDRLLAGGESEIVEFKGGGAGYSTGEIGKYFSALSNEANLRGVDASWLVFGVHDKDRLVIGTDYRRDPARLHALKNEIANGADPSASFRDIHELDHSGGRVLLFEVPPAPRGMPIAWNGHYYARNGESLGSLDLGKLDGIRGQSLATDWSAGAVPVARLDLLDPEALAQARKSFATRHARLSADEVESWPAETFLERAGLTLDGQLTRAAVLLLGKRESAHLLSPLLAEITWRLVGEQEAYEHFGPPFILATTRVYDRIRNVQIRLLPPGTLIQTEIAKYDRASVVEAIHNCVAHADYRTGARIVVTEYVDKIVLENEGAFFDGAPDDYVLGNRTPRTYRNPFLVNAMTELNMIDHLGAGIKRIHRAQARRYLPLPDYDLAEGTAVKLTIPGAVIDANYTDLLMARSDLPLADILALDRVQKGRALPDEMVRRLRRARLIEGRRPHLHVSADIAAATASKADYIHTRAQDDAHYTTLIADYLRQFDSATRQEINQLLWSKLSDALSEQEKENKISNLLAKMRRADQIRNEGSRTKPQWRLAE